MYVVNERSLSWSDVPFTLCNPALASKSRHLVYTVPIALSVTQTLDI